MTAPAVLHCGNCRRETWRLYPCPCGLADCRADPGVCGMCRRGIERRTLSREEADDG